MTRYKFLVEKNKAERNLIGFEPSCFGLIVPWGKVYL